jgi:hypothetical protein
LKGTQTLRKKLQELLVRNDLNDLPGALPAGNAACPEALQGTVQSKAFYQSSPDSAKAEPTASTLKPSASADLPKARTV